MTGPVTTSNAPTPLKIGRKLRSTAAPKAPVIPKTLPVRKDK